MQSALNQVLTTKSTGDRFKSYQALIDKSVASSSDLKTIITHLASEEVSTKDSKPALAYITTKLGDLSNTDCKDVCRWAIAKLESRVMLFVKEDGSFKRECAMVLQAQNDTYGGCLLLQEIKYEPDGMIAEKVDDYLSLAEFYFELNHAPAAEENVNLCTRIIHKIDSVEQTMRYKRCSARVQDSKKDFMRAAQDYYACSVLEQQSDPETANELFKWALTCTILSPAGPRKASLLAVLNKDERAKTSQFYDLLSKMFNKEVVKREHVTEFNNSLKEHQKDVVEGYTLLDKALIEHNIVVISKIYMNITFEQLGNFLGILPDRAETIVAKMISENRITAVLDQQASLVEFEEEGEQQPTFNEQIKTTCENIDSLMKDMLREYPGLQQYDTFVF